jgi:hypothetical protein
MIVLQVPGVGSVSQSSIIFLLRQAIRRPCEWE